MYKNKKGFTLVELLAVIVIVGILAVFAIPMITEMVSNSRNKMYVEDAKKLVARAEYQMKASSSTIEKPDVGNCIVITMAYLQASEIVSAPNGGEYDKDNSYVVIKNLGNGKYDYAVTIIEELPKGGYKGIKLKTYKNLKPSNATALIQPIQKNELLNDIKTVDGSYIRTRLGTEFITNSGEVTAWYHYHEIKDSAIHHVDESAPVFESVTYNDNGSLTATINIKVKDDDTNLSDLNVFYSTNASDQLQNGTSYGSNSVHTITIHFDRAPYNYNHNSGREVPIYITVRDPDGNEAKRQVNYVISKNKPPTIDSTKTTVAKRPQDSYPDTTALVTLEVSDDIDPVNSLKICTKDGIDSAGVATCSNSGYQNYSDVVSNKKFEYTFKCGGTSCARDGKVHYLTIFVKDTMDDFSRIVLPYTFSANGAPEFTENVTVTSTTDGYPSSGSKRVLVRVRAKDDSPVNLLKVHISDGTNSKTYNYSDDNNQNTFTFDLAGTYDGSTKTVTVYLEDGEGAKSANQTVQYTLHNNHNPEITSFTVRSFGLACDKGNICATTNNGTANGSLDAIIELSVVDDLDAADDYEDTLVCVSETLSDCDNNSNYKPYDLYNGRQVQYTFTGQYDGSSRTLYVKVKDSYGKTAQSSATYGLYNDSKPIITDFSMVSDMASAASIAGNAGDAYVSITALDDFSTDAEMLLYLKLDGNLVIDGKKLSELYDLVEAGTDPETGQTLYSIKLKQLVHVTNVYDGKTYQFEAKVKDNKGKISDAATFAYKIFTNTGPRVLGPPTVYKGNNDYGNSTKKFFDVYFDGNFVDDADQVFNVKYCYTLGSTANPSSDHCTGIIRTMGPAHLTSENLFSGLSYTGQTFKIYAIAYDSLEPSKKVQTELASWGPVYNHSQDSPIAGYSIATRPNASSNNLTVYFSANYLFDSYQVCLSNVNSSADCTNYVSEIFDGMDGAQHSLSYTYPGTISSSSKVYIVVKGVGTGKRTVITTDITTAGSCKVKDSDHPYYSYQKSGTAEISTSKCTDSTTHEVKCYHKNVYDGTTNNTTANYVRTITYKDKIGGGACSNFTETETKSMDCSFIKCFYNASKNDYVQDAYGVLPIPDDTPWVEQFDNGVIVTNYSHYQMYKSTYTDGDKDITLRPQSTKRSSYGIRNGLYGQYVWVSPY